MKTLNTSALDTISINSIACEKDYILGCVHDLTTSLVHAVNEAIEYNDVEFDRDSIEDFVNDSLLHETVDQSEFAIYNHYHLPVLQYSANDDYMIENLGGLEDTLKSGGLSGLHQALAFWAMYADVQEVFNDVLDNTDFDLED